MELSLEALGTLAASASDAKRYRCIMVAASAGLTPEALERDPGYSGPDLVFAAEKPDEGGGATFDLEPRRGELEKSLERLGPGAEIATFVIGFPGDDDARARAVAGPVLRVKLPTERLRIDLQIDPAAPESHDDKVILTGPGGYRRVLGVASQGKKHAHAQGMTTVIFEGVRIGGRYTLKIDPGEEGSPYIVLKDHEVTKDDVLPREGA